MSEKILIIGASGFVGSNLLAHFEKESLAVRVISRKPSKVMTSSTLTKVYKADLEDVSSLEKAVSGIETIYYLSHGMTSSDEDFQEVEKRQVENLIKVIDKSVKVIYLSGIIPKGKLSTHLKSREQVGEVLRDKLNTVIEFRASIIIGKGSTSFEMIRALVERVPFILQASWSESLCQPISIDSVVNYLARSSDKKYSETKIFDIGGIEQIRYVDLLIKYAKFMGLKRPVLNINNFPKKIAAEILIKILPEFALVGSRLIESIEHETIVTDNDAQKSFKLKLQTINEMFQQVSEKDLGSLRSSDFKLIFNYLKTNKEVPAFIAGHDICYTIKVSELLSKNSIIENVVRKLGKIPLINIETFQNNLQDELLLKIPFLGEMRLKFSADYEQVLVVIAAKYFFQKAGFNYFNTVVKLIESHLAKRD